MDGPAIILFWPKPGSLYATRARVSSIDRGAILKSMDGGATWTEVSSGFELLAIDPQNQDTMRPKRAFRWACANARATRFLAAKSLGPGTAVEDIHRSPRLR